MAYCTGDEVEAVTGFSCAHFKESGLTMTETQFATLLTLFINRATQLINRYCNVTSFEEHSVVEYHDGRGATGDEKTYLETDRIYHLREPLISLTSVEYDSGSSTSAPTWTTLTPRSADAGGDFMLITRNETSYIRFTSIVPIKGYDNVRITYDAGYVADSPEFYDLKVACIRIVENMLLIKKKIQEATTIRATGTREASRMFEVFNESLILTDDVKDTLARYRRPPGDLYSYE